MVSWVAVPAVSVMAEVVSDASSAEENRSVLTPTGPVSTSPGNVARPETFVAWVGVPVSAAPPESRLTLMLRPAPVTTFPAASCTCTVGAIENAMPLCAVIGWVTTASRAAAPAVSVIVLDVTPVTPALLN